MSKLEWMAEQFNSELLKQYGSSTVQGVIQQWARERAQTVADMSKLQERANKSDEVIKRVRENVAQAWAELGLGNN